MYEVQYLSTRKDKDFETRGGFASKAEAREWAEAVMGECEAWYIRKAD